MYQLFQVSLVCLCLCCPAALRAQINTYLIVDTHQSLCYDSVAQIPTPQSGFPYYGQDAQHAGNPPAFRDNADGTITDLVTGLTWVKARGTKVSWEKALTDAATCTVGGFHDWRMPSIKELYSLIDFRGKSATTAAASIPYIDTAYFAFVYGDTNAGERVIDCQDWSSTTYVHLTMAGDSTAFGVNFADGRIKGYGKKWPPTGARMQLYVRYVRGNTSYGINNFADNGDSTITDRATGLMWTKPDSRSAMNWRTALAWVQARNAASWLGHNDWRLPNAKELQSIVDYTRSPATTNSAAINPMFLTTPVSTNEYPYYWTSTTHLDNMGAVYLCFGRGLGWMQLPPQFSWALYDVHGAGCQRSDPKYGDASAYPHGLGPQGDVIRIENYVRLVRSGTLVPVEMSSFSATSVEPLHVRLDWTTETETNNHGFLVQRRSNNEEEWSALPASFTAGHGSTSAAHAYSYDDVVPRGGEWWYRLMQSDLDGTIAYSNIARVHVSDPNAAADAITLEGHPNPFGDATASTTITFTLAEDAHVRLSLHDCLGREAAVIVDGMRVAGRHQEFLHADHLPAGTYFCILHAGPARRALRVVKLR